MWLLEYSHPERYGRRRRKLPAAANAPRRRVRRTAPTAPESAFLHPSQQSKSLQKCLESQAVLDPLANGPAAGGNRALDSMAGAGSASHDSAPVIDLAENAAGVAAIRAHF